MTHDRIRISALVDGECSVDKRDVVLAHVMGCDDCRTFYQQERAAKAALAAGAAAGTAAPTGLVSSLLALASTRAPAIDRPAARRPRASGPARPAELPGQRRRRVRRAAKGIGFSLLGASLLFAAAFVIGGDARARIPAPQLAAFGTEHEQAAVAASEGGGAATAKAISRSPAGVSTAAEIVLPATSIAPATLAGFTFVSSSAAERGATRSTYSDGASTVSVFRQEGRVETAKLKGFTTHRVDGAKLKRKTGRPGYLVWSCRDVTYTVVGDSAGDLDRVATALPHVCPQKSGWSRVGRGMHRAAGWLNPLS
jgi:Putative zinc-finger